MIGHFSDDERDDSVNHGSIARVLSNHMYMLSLDTPLIGTKLMTIKAHHRHISRENLPPVTEPVYDLEELVQRSMQHSSSSSSARNAASHDLRPVHPNGVRPNAAHLSDPPLVMVMPVRPPILMNE